MESQISTFINTACKIKVNQYLWGLYILLVKIYFSFAFLQWMLSNLFYWGKSLFSKIISHVLMELQTYYSLTGRYFNTTNFSDHLIFIINFSCNTYCIDIYAWHLNLLHSFASVMIIYLHDKESHWIYLVKVRGVTSISLLINRRISDWVNFIMLNSILG